MGGFGAPMGGTPPGGMPLGGSPFGAVPGFGSPLGGVSMGGAPLGAPLGGLPLGGAPLGAPVPVAQAGGIPPMAVFQNSDLSASFTFRKVNPANPALTHITLTVNNTSSAPFDNFVFQGTLRSLLSTHTFSCTSKTRQICFGACICFVHSSWWNFDSRHQSQQSSLRTGKTFRIR